MSKILASGAVWHPEQSPLILNNRWQETEDTASFQFIAQNQTHFEFKAGQFINVEIEINGKKEYRAYSISSIPGDKYLQLTIKRVEGGKVSNWFIDNLQPGDQLNVISIAGQFNLNDCQYSKRILLLSAGCGITPVMSMARALLDSQQPVDIVFVHCARDQDNIIYQKEVQALGDKYTNFNYRFLLEKRFGVTDKLAEQLNGQINKEKLDLLSADWQQRSIFLCGPMAFMKVVKDIVQQASFDMSLFHQESFTLNQQDDLHIGLASSKDNVLCSSTKESNVFSVAVPSFNYKADVVQGSALLDALEQGGIPVIAACRQGICGSCKCKVTQGKVNSISNDIISEEERNQGWVLACSSKVEGDVEVSLS
ncbi:hybrid-cluster NAD(P)-dependent oxidoreductase [Zooshikella harenae]|uniref:Hybrid-cluster NAD(P)-dependent oxidoreductase n=1 Tax=Zooshikella harenae TaxID=2827238 RepID=A0ABS5ZF97_9GAMM|nr:hybrid-cluster NAD(P)-dependent oxidoreductase [Zooshikella harenae]MBU2712733.1 hybrid-cluster NAD(P)-dependent oxidoreductase [Zooshikella harenae]